MSSSYSAGATFQKCLIFEKSAILCQFLPFPIIRGGDIGGLSTALQHIFLNLTTLRNIFVADAIYAPRWSLKKVTQMDNF